MNMENNITEFYDNFSSDQLKTGINDRIASLFYRIRKNGVNSKSKILELGCGIGVLSNIILKKVKPTYLESVDLSPKSIELIQNLHKNKNNFFSIAADVVDYRPKGTHFDFITLFDVIEHIPLERHPALFENLSNLLTNNSKLLINIPAPNYLKYVREHNPELLQIVDQEIYLDVLAKNIYSNGLEILFFETYSLWNTNDYQFIVIKKKTNQSEADLKLEISLLEKISRKVKRTLLK